MVCTILVAMVAVSFVGLFGIGVVLIVRGLSSGFKCPNCGDQEGK